MAEYGARTPWSDRGRHPAAHAGSRSDYGRAVKAVPHQRGRRQKAIACPAEYSGKYDKQKIALEIAAADRVREGPICALTAVELCNSYAIRRDEQ